MKTGFVPRAKRAHQGSLLLNNKHGTELSTLQMKGINNKITSLLFRTRLIGLRFF